MLVNNEWFKKEKQFSVQQLCEVKGHFDVTGQDNRNLTAGQITAHDNQGMWKTISECQILMLMGQSSGGILPTGKKKTTAQSDESQLQQQH